MAVTTLIAMKCTDDNLPVNNKAFAQIIGMSTPELNYLEAGTLQMLEFDVHIELATYMTYVRHLARPTKREESAAPTIEEEKAE